MVFFEPFHAIFYCLLYQEKGLVETDPVITLATAQMDANIGRNVPFFLVSLYFVSSLEVLLL
jgi:hypothetical protein